MADDDEWVSCGGERIWRVDVTTAGFPIGCTESEIRRASLRESPAAGWARAKMILADVFEDLGGPGTQVEVGWVRKAGSGTSREAYYARVELSPDQSRLGGTYIVLLLRRDAGLAAAERARREHALLAHLARRALPFRVPVPVAAVDDHGCPALVQEPVPGIELDLRAGRQHAVSPWNVVGAVAAGVHAIDPVAVGLGGAGHATRRAHALAALAALDEVQDPCAAAARAWALAHLPPDTPGALLHGDLLGQNILLAPGEPPGLIDWEYADRGDPAYDLAIVTRGHRRPFQVAGGLERLLDAYRGHGGDPAVTGAHVYLHELCLLASWVRDAQLGRGAHPPEIERDRLRAFVRRLDGHPGLDRHGG
jgi:aminoglycoside phosphotransferase (APT) family kinase protein